MSNYSTLRSAYSLKRASLVLLLPLFCASPLARAQEAIRPSLAGEAAAEARRQNIDRIPYNIQLGPVKFRFSMTLGVEYNDNVNLSENDAQDDVIIRPQFNVDALWPITQLNTLKLDLGIGYGIYINHPEYNTNGILVSPGSQLSFDIFISDFRINFHDRFSLQQDAVTEVALSNVADYGRFENTLGVSVLWDLNKAVLTFGYDHYNFVSTTSVFDYLNRNAEIISASAYFALSSTTGVGLESSAVYSYYDNTDEPISLNDSTTYSVGAFVETQFTSYLKIRAAAGYQFIEFDEGGSILDPNDASDFYANVLISHRVTPSITQSLAFGHETQLGVNSNYIALNYIRHTATWNIINRTLISTELFYEDADDSGGIFSERIHRYGGAITAGYQFTQHLTLGVRYQYTQKDSDAILRDYRHNRVSVDGTYSF